MPEEKNECRTGMPCGLPKSGNACMNRTTACCLKCGWNPDEQVRRRALPLVKGADGLLHKDISTNGKLQISKKDFTKLTKRADALLELFLLHKDISTKE